MRGGAALLNKQRRNEGKVNQALERNQALESNQALDNGMRHFSMNFCKFRFVLQSFTFVSFVLIL